MRKIKTFESFNNDNSSDNGGNMPGYNPILNQQAKEFVDSKMKTSDMDTILKRVGIKVPKDLTGQEMDNFYDKAKEKMVKFFIENPEEMTDNINIKSYSVPAGDGVVRVQNIGGALRER
jgi:hypothetical protein